MEVSYDVFDAAFLAKITEYEFAHMTNSNRYDLVDGFRRRACAQFGPMCKFDIVHGDDDNRTFDFGDEATEADVDEIVDIVSEGMVCQWFRQYFYAADNLKNMLNTNDYTAYSPAELLNRMTAAYEMCKHDFTQMVREYSYRHGDLTVLHL